MRPVLVIALAAIILFYGCASTESAIKNYQTVKGNENTHGAVKSMGNDRLNLTIADPVKTVTEQVNYVIYEDGTKEMISYFAPLGKGESIFVRGKQGGTYKLRFVGVESKDIAAFELIGNTGVISTAEATISTGGSFVFKDDAGVELTNEFGMRGGGADFIELYIDDAPPKEALVK